MAGNIDKLKREKFSIIRGRMFKSEVGFVLKVARENIHSHFYSNLKSWTHDLDGLLEEHNFEDLMYLT